MRNVGRAVVISILVHGFIAFLLVRCLRDAAGPDVSATLDLTSVELSFAEKVEEATAAVFEPSCPHEPPMPEVAENLSELDRNPLQPPDPPVTRFPEPREDPPALAELKQAHDPPASHSPPPAPPSAAPRQARIDVPPCPKRTIRPDYPRESRLRGEQGDVTLELGVSADGSVSSVRVVKSPGFALLEKAAVRAVRAAHFTPATSGGVPVSSTVCLTLSFRFKRAKGRGAD